MSGAARRICSCLSASASSRCTTQGAEEIAVEIGVCYVTIYRELKRGDTGEMDELGRRVYDAELAQRKAALARRNKGSKNPENDGRCRRRGQNTDGETQQDSGQQV